MPEENKNEIGLNGFGFVEFASPPGANLDQVFVALGFTEIGRHRTKNVQLFRQGNIDLLLNGERYSHAEDFTKLHGPCACGMSFQVDDAAATRSMAIARGAKTFEHDVSPFEHRLPVVKGIGGAALYFIERDENGNPDYEQEFDLIDDHENASFGFGFHTIDHLTHNVYRGKLGYWANFYERVFDFYELRYFDIEGEKTGLQSKAMASPDGTIRIPINEESASGGGQIDEYLEEYKGEGIQHIALACDDLYACCERLKRSGVKFMEPPPHAYYELLDERLPGHGEPVERMERQGILVDGSTKDGVPKLLLQIFSANSVGPIFFEFIQRKRDEGFGEGNFQALFESIERDQLNRGVLQG